MAEDNAFLAGLAQGGSSFTDTLQGFLGMRVRGDLQKELLREKDKLSRISVAEYESLTGTKTGLSPEVMLPTDIISEISKIRQKKPEPPIDETAFLTPKKAEEMSKAGIKIKGKYEIVNPEKFKSAEEVAEEKASVKKAYGKPKATSSFKNAKANLKSLVSTVDELLNDKRLSSGSGISGFLLGKIPATAARDIQAKIDTIKSKTSLNALTEMRVNSPTGGALGQVSDAEGVRLENNVAALDPRQSDKDFRKQLIKLKLETEAAIGRLNNGYAEDFGEAPPTDEQTESDLEGKRNAIRRKLGLK